VDADKVDTAAIALLQKIGKPVEAHASAAIGDRRGAKVHQVLHVLRRLHVLLPRSDGVGDGHAGATSTMAAIELANLIGLGVRATIVVVEIDLRAVVRLIEAQQMRRLIRVHIDSGAYSIVPVANKALRITPEHRDVL
jgi:hypothetical protein